jgi:hypothetical protein
MRLEKVAVRISRDLGQVVFVGAFAVRCHIGLHAGKSGNQDNLQGKCRIERGDEIKGDSSQN